MQFITKRKIDELSRVLLPREQLEKLGLKAGDQVAVYREQDGLFLRAVSPKCVLCGAEIGLVEIGDKHMCKPCLAEMKEQIAALEEEER